MYRGDTGMKRKGKTVRQGKYTLLCSFLTAAASVGLPQFEKEIKIMYNVVLARSPRAGRGQLGYCFY